MTKTVLPAPPIVLVIDGEHVIVIGRLHCLVESKSRPTQYHTVSFEDEEWSCTCESGVMRKSCRHQRAIREWMLGRAKVSVHAE